MKPADVTVAAPDPAEMVRCVTCGSRVTVHAADEGTCSYVAWDDAATTALLAERQQDKERIERDAAKLVLLAIRRGDEFWQEQLQHTFDLTIAEAKTLARDAALAVEEDATE